MKYNYYIFDLDGTLIDTEQAVLQTWQMTLKEFFPKRVFSLDDLKIVLGIPSEAALKKLNLCTEKDFADRWIDNYSIFSRKTTYFPGVTKALQTLKSQNCQLGIVTSRKRKEYDEFFKSFNLDQFFTIMLWEEDTEKHKPDPQPLYKYLKLTGAKPETCIYIGDMSTDILCAKASGMAGGLAAWKDCENSYPEADYIFRKPEEICCL